MIFEEKKCTAWNNIDPDPIHGPQHINRRCNLHICCLRILWSRLLHEGPQAGGGGAGDTAGQKSINCRVFPFQAGLLTSFLVGAAVEYFLVYL